MKKKSKIIISILIIAILLFLSYQMFLSPKGEEGQKEVTIHIINEDQNVDEKFTYNTEEEFLIGLLEEKEEELGITFERSDMGTMVTGIMNYEADPDKKEFFLISVNGQDSMKGIDEIPLIDKDVYKFELTNY